MTRTIRPSSAITDVNRPKIREWRKARRLSQQELADRVGASDKSTVAHWEKGSRDVGGQTLAALAEALGTTVPRLFMHPDSSEITLTPDEAEIVARLRTASPRDRLLVEQLLSPQPVQPAPEEP